MVARGDGMCCPFVSLTAGKRAALPSPAGDHEGHPYESSGLLPLFMASVDAYWAPLAGARFKDFYSTFPSHHSRISYSTHDPLETSLSGRMHTPTNR